MKSSCRLIFLLLIFQLFFGRVDGLTPVELEMLRAQDFLEAGDPAAAREIYGRLLDREGQPWKKCLLAYDIATTYLMGGEWLEALNHYDAVILGDKPFPPLVFRLKENMAIAHWRLAEQEINQLNYTSLYFEEEYFNIFFLLMKALKNIDEAEKAHCELMNLEGDTVCVPASDVEKLRLAVEQRRAVLFEEYVKDKISRLSIKEALPLMISGLTSLQDSLNYFEGASMDKIIEGEQIERLFGQSSSWLPLWASVAIKIKKELPENKINYFENADMEFLKALQELKEGAWAGSKSAVQHARKSLNELFFLLLEEDPILEIFRKILAEYDRALASTEIQEEVLNNLMAQQTTIKELLKRKKIATDKLEGVQQELERALNYSHAGQNSLARIYLLLSYQKMLRFSWPFEAEKGRSAEQVLEHIISEQSFSYILNNLMFDALDKHEPSILKLVREAQTGTLQVAELFWEAALKAQKHSFQTEGIEDNKKNALRCQFQPWATVMPLFEKGVDEATGAFDVLMKQPWNRISKDHQQSALKDWKEALEKLKNTPPSDSCESPPSGGGGGGGSQKKQPENKSEEKETQTQAQQSQKTSIQEVLRLLQQMDQDDRQKGQQKSTTELREKAW